MSRKVPIIFISGWLTTLTFILFLCEWWNIPLSPAAQAAMFLLAVGPTVICALLVRNAVPARSVTQILYDQEHGVDALAREEAR